MATIKNGLAQIVLPRRRANPAGNSFTSTYNPSQTGTVLSVPAYRDHLTDLFTSRQSQDARTLLRDLSKFDSDVSAAFNAYLTTCDTEPVFLVRDVEGNIDREGMVLLQQLINSLDVRSDYSTGFKFSQSVRATASNLRYMVLLRGGCAAELVFNKLLMPAEIRHVDLASVEWFEEAPAQYRPIQKPDGSNEEIDLNIPNFFVEHYRQNPTEIYTHSPFVSSINTVAARQQVINDLYRIMQKTGYPRMEATVVEEVLRKNAPSAFKTDENEMSRWINARITEISNQLSNLRPDGAYVHTDAVSAKILNDKGPGTSMDVKSIIDVLNSQNQAALKTMATIIGRGESGVNTASVEARIFSLSADSLNKPVAAILADMFTLALRMMGSQSYVLCKFKPVELRPETELEPHRVMKQSRLLEELSLGLITDDEYHWEMHHRPRPDGSPELSGTNFMQGNKASVDVESISPNSDPTGRSITPENSRSARSNETN